MNPVVPTPKELLSALLPFLKVAGAYAQQIQKRIAIHPDKYDGDHLFANALTDADLSIQTFIEVVLLAKFPNLRFYGEEYEQSFNTKYFRAIDLGPQGDYLITFVNADGFEAAIALSPANNKYYYSLRNQGTFVGSMDDDLDQCHPLKIDHPAPKIVLGTALSPFADKIREGLLTTLDSPDPVIDLKTAYSSETPVPPINGLLTGEVAGSILASAQFIDTAALAWMASEMGYQLTTYDGKPTAAPANCENYRQSEIIVSANEALQNKLVEIMKSIQHTS